MAISVPPAHAEGAGAFSRHVLERTVVLPQLRVLFVPVPKAACTSLLWTLATLAGLRPERFDASPLPEVSPALTVHDMNLWPDRLRFGRCSEAERERLLAQDGWLRFSVVRDPAARLWSGWQSKLLLREPRFVEQFGSEPWFPRVPEHPGEIVEDFRAFVAALDAGRGEDVHWAVQRTLTAQLPLTHIGRVERLDETLQRLRAHVARPLEVPPGRRENRSPLSQPPGLYDRATAAALDRRYAADRAAFGYGAAPDADAGADALAAWAAEVEPLLPLVRATIDEHDRLGQLHRIAQRRRRRAQSAERRLEQRAPRAGATARNREGERDFDVRWAWSEERLRPGFTAVVRVRDEARNLPWVLPPLLRAVSRVVLLDNGSGDGTIGVATAVAREAGAADRLEVDEYPFAIARCGDEHLQAPADSVHSLTYFYNWSFAHVRTTYALKWDGDMVLTDAAVATLRDLGWQLEAAAAVLRVPRHPLYVLDDRHAFLDTALRNCEPWGWPNGPQTRFVKALDWELPLWPEGTPAITLPDWGCVELKHLDADEFAHWSHTDFDASSRTRRKQREWEVFQALNGGGAPPEGVVAITAPPGTHVIEHVRTRWLPARAAGER